MSDTDFYIRYYVGMCLESLESGHFWYYSSVGVYGVSDATFAQTRISKWSDNFINGTLFYIIYQFHNSFLGLLTRKKGHKGKFGHEFLEFEFRPDGKMRYANNSNYKNDTMIRKEAYVNRCVLSGTFQG